MEDQRKARLALNAEGAPVGGRERIKLENTDNKTSTLTRREFMKAAGVTAAGLAVGSTIAKSPVYAVQPSRVIGANDRIVIGIIGPGGQGGHHLNVIKGQPADANVAIGAVCDVWEKRRLAARDAAGLTDAKAYKDYRKLIADKDLDAVLIATPEHWHAQIAIDAMENGLHCYVEKPMCRTLDEVKALRAAALKTKRIVQVGSQGCTDTKWHVAAEQIKKGKIGKLVWSQGSYCRNNPSGEWNYDIDPSANTGNLNWEMWQGKLPKIPWNPEHYFRWRKYQRYSAGILSDLFPHRLHPLMIAVGAEYPVQVATIGSLIGKPDRDVADNTQILVRFANGSHMVIAGSTVNEQGLQDMIRGTKATIYFGGGKVQIMPERPFADEIEQEDVPVVGPGEDIAEHQRNWFHCIRTNGVPNCNIDLASKVQTIVTLAEMSWKQKKLMNFDPVKMKVV